MNSRVPSNGADQLTSLRFAEVCKGCSRRGGRPRGPWSWRLSVTVSLACPGSPLLLLPHVHEVRLQGAAAELAPVCLPRHQRSSTAHPGRTADPARVSRPLPPFVSGGAGWSGAETSGVWVWTEVLLSCQLGRLDSEQKYAENLKQ